MNAPPNALRSTSVTFGTLASAKACTSFAPWRITPPFSCFVPGMKPGVSTNTSSGMPNALQVRTNFAPLEADSESSTPPMNFGWLAMMPTGLPSMRAKPQTMLRAQRGPHSSIRPPSTTPRTTSRTS